MAVAREACKKHHDGELKYYKTMAIFVKEQLDAKLGNSWHICVGKFRNISLHVSHFEFLSIALSVQVLTLEASALMRRRPFICSGWNILASWCGNTDEKEVARCDTKLVKRRNVAKK